MKTGIICLILGLITGTVATLLALSSAAPDLIIREMYSPHSVDETVARIESAVRQAKWSVQSIESLHEKLEERGQKGILPTKLINICRADYAGEILRDDKAHKAAVLMPCTIAVYQKSDGKTYVSTMNAGLMGKLFGGIIARIMGEQVAIDQESFLKAL